MSLLVEVLICRQRNRDLQVNRLLQSGMLSSESVVVLLDVLGEWVPSGRPRPTLCSTWPYCAVQHASSPFPKTNQDFSEQQQQCPTLPKRRRRILGFKQGWGVLTAEWRIRQAQRRAAGFREDQSPRGRLQVAWARHTSKPGGTGPPAPTPAGAGMRGRSEAGRNLDRSEDLEGRNTGCLGKKVWREGSRVGG